ncbi:MAG: glycosyltransferase [Gemmataceae bacterium]|nr:glycosyltransferase [Gemmataceae bacterium]
MRVSVVVPLYNKARWIQRTLDSALSQTFADFELLVVDDGSTDGGGDIVARCTHPRVRLIRQPNAGPGAARNRGLAEAKGELAAFLDADDEWLPTFLQKSVAALDAHPEAACVSSGYIQHPAGKPMDGLWRERGLKDGFVRLSPETPPLFAVHLLAYLCPWNTVARLGTVRRHGGFFDAWRCLYAEDSFLWLQVLLNAPVLVRMEPLVAFHTEASALSGNLKGARPVEPMLLHPERIEASCPPPLRPLLSQILAIRAIKTACMLSYWGKWREGRALLKRFVPWSAWRLPRFAVASLAATPFGAGAGRLVRLVLGQGGG